jgi:hypothetical protein
VFDLPGSNRHKYTIREEIRALYGPNTTVPVYLALIFNTLLYVYAVTGTSYECLINVRPSYASFARHVPTARACMVLLAPALTPLYALPRVACHS